MKNIKYVLVALLGMSVFSCQDAIDIVQPGELYEPTTFKTVADLQQGLMGVYATLSIDSEIDHASIWTDECRIGTANSGQGLIDGQYNFQLNEITDAAASIYQGNYVTINFANRLIRAAKGVTPKAGEESLYNDIVAQAHIIRAWGHFRLLCYYSTDLTNDDALGTIYMDHVPTLTEAPGRSTNGFVFTKIDEDLAFVTDLSTNAGNADRTLISPDFVKAFKARMAAYRGQYATAKTLAQELIASYPLTPRADYTKIWTDATTLAANKNEVIFKLLRVQGDSKIGSTWATNNATATGALIFEMSTNLWNQFNGNKATDIRYTAFVEPSSTGAIHAIGKYAGTTSIPLLRDVKIFRTSEMYFIKAEAQADANDLSGVTATLQAINNARYSVNKSVTVLDTAEKAWAEILKQRSFELCYEGHRYLDLKRLATKANVDLVRDPADCAVNGACFLARDSYKFTFPIPKIGYQANPAVKAQQNPGYNNN